jgi:hypothetical protein
VPTVFCHVLEAGATIQNPTHQLKIQTASPHLKVLAYVADAIIFRPQARDVT